jgi:hypothetical protein
MTQKVERQDGSVTTRARVASANGRRRVNARGTKTRGGVNFVARIVGGTSEARS